jgi:NADH-quinone oxidoreductase subunit J
VVAVVFWVAFIVALLGGISVVWQREPLKSVLSLVAVMIALSVIFLILSAQFVFAVQVIVYAGAVMVLFLFVIALLGPAREERSQRLRFQTWLALLLVVVLAGLGWSLLSGVSYRAPQKGDLNVFGSVEQIAAGLFSTYLYPFEVTSILLLVAAIGAIYLSRRERE